MSRWFKSLNSKRRVILISSMVTLILVGLSLTPAHGAEIKEYSLAGDYRPRGIALDSAGNVWFTEQFGNRIGKLSGSTIYEWNIFTLSSEPWDVTVDNQGNVWFTEYTAHHVARFREGVLVEFDLTGLNPLGITVDNDPAYQSVWFAEYGDAGTNGKIGRIYFNGTADTPRDKWILVEYELPLSGATKRQPYDVAVSPVNGLVWFTDQGTGDITSFNPWTIQFREYDIAAAASSATLGSYEVWGITVDRDGFVWASVDLTDANEYDKICRLNPWTSEVVFYDIPTKGADPLDISVDSDGNIWFVEYSKNNIGRLNPLDRFITEYTIPTMGSYPAGIAIESSSTTIWFTEWASNKIGRLDPSVGRSYSTVTTITSATTTTVQSIATSTSTIQNKQTKSLYSSHTPATPAASPYVTYLTRTGENSTNMYTPATLSINTETVFVIPTSTTATTTHLIVHTFVTKTTVVDTLTSYVHTITTNTTITLTETYFTPVATESATVTRHAAFTDVVSTTTLTEYSHTVFRDKTVTVPYYTAYSTSTLRTTATSYTTTTVTTTVYTTLTAGLGWGAPLLAITALYLMWSRNRGLSK